MASVIDAVTNLFHFILIVKSNDAFEIDMFSKHGNKNSKQVHVMTR